MNQRRDNLLSIGGFAEATQLSIKALRLYDRLCLLKPVYVDPDSSYRYYHAEQLHTARYIRTLRQMDMPLAHIRRVLVADDEQAARLIAEYQRGVEARAALVRRTVNELLAQLRKEEPAMTLNVEVRDVPPQPIISITRHVKVDQLSEHIRSSLVTLYDLLEAQGMSASGAPFGIYHGQVNDEDDGPMEVCVPVVRVPQVTGEVRAGELPGGRVAYTEMRGVQCVFPAVLEGYDAVIDWIRQNGYVTEGSPREIWLGTPGEDSPDDRMEIGWLFRERTA